MALLPKPYSFLHRRAGRFAGPGPTFKVTAYAEGEAQFSPKDGSGPVTRPCLRIWIERLDRPSPAYYYDISSPFLAAQLKGYLTQGAITTTAFRVRAYGKKPSKRLALDAIPLSEV